MREHARRPEAVGERRRPRRASSPSVRTPRRRAARAAPRSPHGSRAARPAGRRASARHPLVEHERAARAHRQGGRQRAEARRPGPHARVTIAAATTDQRSAGGSSGALGGGDRGGVRAVQRAQPAGLEVGQPGARRLDGRADRLQRAHRGLPGLLHPHGIQERGRDRGSGRAPRRAPCPWPRHEPRRRRRLPPGVARSRRAALPPARVRRAPALLRRREPARIGGDGRTRPYTNVCSHMAKDRMLLCSSVGERQVGLNPSSAGPRPIR